MASKTARKNMRASGQSERASSYDGRLLISCNEGRNAYVFNPATSKNPNLAVGSAAFYAAVGDIAAAGHQEQISAELHDLALTESEWDQVREVLAA